MPLSFSEVLLSTSSTYHIVSPGNSTSNTFMNWNVRTLNGSPISLQFEKISLDTPISKLYFGQGIVKFNVGNDSCNSWEDLSHVNDGFVFTSRSSSIRFIYTTSSSIKDGDEFIILLKATDAYNAHTRLQGMYFRNNQTTEMYSP